MRRRSVLVDADMANNATQLAKVRSVRMWQLHAFRR